MADLSQIDTDALVEGLATAALAPASFTVDGMTRTAQPLPDVVDAISAVKSFQADAVPNPNGGRRSGWNRVITGVARTPGPG